MLRARGKCKFELILREVMTQETKFMKKPPIGSSRSPLVTSQKNLCVSGVGLHTMGFNLHRIRKACGKHFTTKISENKKKTTTTTTFRHLQDVFVKFETVKVMQFVLK